MKKDKIELKPPCSYQGGKARLSSRIVDEIFENSATDDNTVFYDMCCGSGAITLELIGRGVHPSNIVMVDMGMFGAFWNSIANDEFILEDLKKEIDKLPDVEDIQGYLKDLAKETVDDDLAIYQYLLLQSGSFGSKQIWVEDNEWKNASFRSYWKPTPTSSRRSPVNPMMPMPNTLLDRVSSIVDALGGIINAIQSDINDISWDFDSNSIVYIDPPYKETTGYGFEFDYLGFVDKYSDKCDIYISEKEIVGDPKKSIALSKGRSKGGINGSKKKKSNEEWLNLFREV